MTTLLFINYIDRGNLATVGPLLIDSLKLIEHRVRRARSPRSTGPMRRRSCCRAGCAQRVDLYRLLTVGVLLWSLTTAATVLAAGFATLLALRLVLGLGESVVFPASSVLFAELVPETRRGAANGWMNTGPGSVRWSAPSPAPRSRRDWGWQATFLIFGVASLLWLWPWLRFAKAAPHVAPVERGRPPPYRELLGHRAAWGTFIGHFSNNYSFYFLITGCRRTWSRCAACRSRRWALVGGAGVLQHLCARLGRRRLVLGPAHRPGRRA